MRIAVSTVSPFGYVHSQAFAEVALCLHAALIELGHDAIVSTRFDNRRRLHLVLGANLLARYPHPLPDDAVIYNLEQVQVGSKWWNDDYLALLRRHRVWDYSRSNLEALAALGVVAEHLPLGYMPLLTRIVPQPHDIDVLFYGSLNPRRGAVIEALRAAGVRTEAVFGIYGTERDRLIARSRIVLNVHYYPAKVFEVVRVSYLLANRVCVVSETGADPGEEAGYAGGVRFAEYEALVPACLDLLRDPSARDAQARRGYEIVAAQPMVPALRAALAKL